MFRAVNDKDVLWSIWLNVVFKQINESVVLVYSKTFGETDVLGLVGFYGHWRAFSGIVGLLEFLVFIQKYLYGQLNLTRTTKWNKPLDI